MAKEYKRTCKACGNTWHSLASRESQISLDMKSNAMSQCGAAMQGCGTCGMCGTKQAALNNRNVQADKSELDRLRSCPSCGSSSYDEEIVDYD